MQGKTQTAQEIFDELSLLNPHKSDEILKDEAFAIYQEQQNSKPMSNLEQAAKGKYGWIPGASDTWNQVREYQMRAFIDGWTDCASYHSQNSVSKEHYDELKLNYDIMVERLNERERELQKQVNDLLEALEYILANSMDIHVVEQQAKAAINSLK